ncbi:MAG: pyridoxal-phosphate dependent enzyme [Pseudomonadota bacterium]
MTAHPTLESIHGLTCAALRPAARKGPHASILDTIGRTPVVRLTNIAPDHVELYAKLEAFNPMGSIKDRMAIAMIEAAERSGALQPGQTVIEATSGNTGLGLAMVCAQKGYPLVIVMAESFSVERRKLLRFLGAKVVLTAAAERGTGMFSTAERLAEAHGWFFCRQFENQANADIHTATTAREILSDFATLGLDYWVTGFGTGGTLQGVARLLQAESPRTEIVAVEPENSQILNNTIPQQRRPDGAAARSHPDARAHPIQGWSPDFVPKLAGDALDDKLIDRFETVSGAEAIRVAGELATREGILSGTSGGATVAAALQVAERAPRTARILAMIPDTGERYLSTPLFDGIEVDMTAEEQAIAASVPPIARKPQLASARPKPAAWATAYAKQAIIGWEAPVVMFGFEWCEFCWSVRKLLDRAGIPYRANDVDSPAFREGDRGGEILRALFEITGKRTVPQVFVGGELVGGATDVLAAFDAGTLKEALTAVDPTLVIRPVPDAMGLLPSWVRRTPKVPANADGAPS